MVTVLRSRRVVLPDGERPAAVVVDGGRIADVAPYETAGEDLGPSPAVSGRDRDSSRPVTQALRIESMPRPTPPHSIPRRQIGTGGPSQKLSRRLWTSSGFGPCLASAFVSSAYAIYPGLIRGD